MRTKEKGITLIVLAVTILVVLIVLGVTITSIITDKGIIKQSQNAKEIHIEKRFNESIQLAITKARMDYHDKKIDKGYFEEIKNYLSSTNDFKNKATYSFINYNKDLNIEDENVEDNQVNALIVNISNYKYIINENGATLLANNSSNQSSSNQGSSTVSSEPHQHNYKYYNLDGTEIGTEHPATIGIYKYKCVGCGDEISHEVTVEYEDKDENEHYIYKCNCGLEPTENHILGDAATCTTSQKCIKCNRILVSSLNHDFTSQTVTDTYKKLDATCTDAAVYYYKCSRCDESSKDNTNATYSSGSAKGHSWSSHTWPESGTITLTCQNCTATQKHTIVKYKYYNDSKHYYRYCNTCLHYYQLKDHNWGYYCTYYSTSQHNRQQKCKDCNATKGSVTKHSMTYVTTAGQDKIYKCATCSWSGTYKSGTSWWK